MCLQRKRKNHFYELNTMKHNWEYKKLGEVCEILDSKRKPVTKKDRKVGQYPYYGAMGIQDYVDSFIFDGDYLLVGEDGAKWGANDKSAFQVHGKCWVNNHAHILKVNEDEICSSFIEHYLVGKDLSSYITGAVVPKLTQASLVSIPIPLPPLPIQQKIVAELDKVCLIIDKKKQQLKELDNLAQAIFYDMFGDPVENEKGWDTCMLGDMCEIGSSKRIFAEEYTETGIPFYRGKEVSEKSKGQPTSIELYISSNRYAEIKDKYGVPKIGDILLTAVGTIGNIWVVDSDEPFYFKDGNVLWLQKKTEASSVYLKYLLEDLIEVYKKSMANGCAYNALTIMNLKKMPISIIPLSLQQSFAAKIEAIEKQKELISRSIKEAQTLFDERMDYWFD